MKHSVSFGTRLPGHVATEITETARRLNVSTSEMIRRLVIERLSATADACVYLRRSEAREAAAELRKQGIATIVVGGRSYWRIVKLSAATISEEKCDGHN